MLDPKEKQDANSMLEEFKKMNPEDQVIVSTAINVLRQRQVLEEQKAGTPHEAQASQEVEDGEN